MTHDEYWTRYLDFIRGCDSYIGKVVETKETEKRHNCYCSKLYEKGERKNETV